MIKHKWVVLAVTGILAGCGPNKEPVQDAPSVTAPVVAKEAAPRFAVDMKTEVAGDYVPATVVQHQNWRLKHVAFKDGAAMRHWMTSQDRTVQTAPVLLVFEDMEEGSRTPAGERRTLTLVPAGFDLSDDKVGISAISAGLGLVTFEGEWSPDGKSLRGAMKVGPQSFENITLNTKTGSR